MNEAELLFSSILNCNRLFLYLNKKSLLDKDNAGFVSSVLRRRINGEPIQYILGKTEFMGFEFKVTPDVLIPRPETEILVETVLQFASRLKAQGSGLNILDIGTGSGNIAISLAKFLHNVKITAVDISQEAIEVAQNNAVLNSVGEKINFINKDFFAMCHVPCAMCQFSFDFIVSNPPYIPSEEIDKLQPEIKYEPRIALDGGLGGLDFYRRLIAGSIKYLKKGGLLILEMGFNQNEALKNIFQKFEDFEIIEVVKDYNNIERVIVARRKP